ncbi:MAG: cation transporter [Clostridia bacterium]|nr:cation transporter [Clostridia bacterium]
MIALLSRLFLRNTKDEDSIRHGYGMICGAVGIFLNLILSCFKIVLGVLIGSLAIQADGFNNLGDVGSSLVSLGGFILSNKKPDTEHPFGHGRAEYLSALIIAFLILLMGVELIKSSVQSLISHAPAPVFTVAAFVVLLCSIVVKLYMALYNTRYGKKYDSSAMLATAKDSLFDCITSGAVLLSMALNHFWHLNADPWCSLAVSLLILWGGFGTAKETVDLLLGKKADPELLQSIADTVMGYEGVLGVHDLIVHDYGPGRLMITLHAEVDEDADMLSTHDMIDNIEWELNKKYNCLSTIHMDPIAVNNPETDQAKALVKQAMGRIDERITIHDFRLVRGQTHTNLVFDISAPYEIKLTDGELKARAVAEITALNEAFNPVITVDRR